VLPLDPGRKILDQPDVDLVGPARNRLEQPPAADDRGEALGIDPAAGQGFQDDFLAKVLLVDHPLIPAHLFRRVGDVFGEDFPVAFVDGDFRRSRSGVED